MAKRVSCHYNSIMLKLLKTIWVLIFILDVSTIPLAARAESSENVSTYWNASDLIQGVNAIRSSQGLHALQTNSILMSIAQQQAEYELSIRSLTDTGANGSRPYQRALASGYLLAGDLSHGGFLAELIYAGVGIGPSSAVTWWNNDPYHHSMLVSTFMQMLVQVWQHPEVLLILSLSPPSLRAEHLSPTHLLHLFRFTHPRLSQIRPTRTVQSSTLSNPATHLVPSAWPTMLRWQIFLN